jgi:CO dehydrogenase/acetyl-CoA synthase beta subunit
MDIFDDTIAEIRDWFEEKRKTDQARIFKISRLKNLDGLHHEAPVTDRGSAGIILKEDTHIELGHPSVGSCCAALATYDADLVYDGRITLVGPDVLETRAERLPFSQIIIASIKGQPAGEVSQEATVMIDKISSLMDRIAHGAAQVEGYMIRSVPNLIWARVSKDAALKGFSLQMLGERLIRALKENCENVVRCEICFATSAKADIEKLDNIIEAARAKTRKLESFKLGADGGYECTQEQDCGTCSEQVVCDNIRDVIKIRKGDRVISFGKEDMTDSTR